MFFGTFTFSFGGSGGGSGGSGSEIGVVERLSEGVGGVAERAGCSVVGLGEVLPSLLFLLFNNELTSGLTVPEVFVSLVPVHFVFTEMAFFLLLLERNEEDIV